MRVKQAVSAVGGAVEVAGGVVGGAITNLTFKHTRHDREVGAIYSASKLARKLFSTLQGGDALLTVEGESSTCRSRKELIVPQISIHTSTLNPTR